jgi:hypothetical protein
MNTIYCSPSCNNKDYKKAIRENQIAEFMEEEKKKTPKVDILGGKDFLTPTEGASLLGLSRATFYCYMSNGTILTAYEISKMDLSNVSLAVLSACETANGFVDNIEGTQGLHLDICRAYSSSCFQRFVNLRLATTNFTKNRPTMTNTTIKNTFIINVHIE